MSSCAQCDAELDRADVAGRASVHAHQNRAHEKLGLLMEADTRHPVPLAADVWTQLAFTTAAAPSP